MPQEGPDAEEVCLTPADLARLLHGAGADPSAASADWVAGHARWVVWKLARWEAAVPRLAGRLLTVPAVLDQLAHRSVPTPGRWRHTCNLTYHNCDSMDR